MTSSKYLHCIVLSIFLLSAGCSRDATPRTVQTDASGDAVDSTFVVDSPVTLVQAKQAVSNSQWSLAGQNAMTFKACMKDVFNNQPIIGENFTVNADNMAQTTKTDNEGCVSWTQNLSFDFLKDEQYVASDVWVDGAGSYRGRRHIPLAVDPWTTDNSAMVDTRAEPNLVKLTGSSVNSALASMTSALTMGRGGTQMRVDKLVVEAIDNRYNGNTAQVHYHLLLNPQITRRGIKGDMVTSQLMTGHFRLSLALIEHKLQANSDQDQRTILAETSVDAPDSNGLISVDVPMDLLQKPSDQSLVELAFNLSPVDAPFQLMPLEGFVQMSGLYAGGDPTVHELPVPFTPYVEKAKIQRKNSATTSAASTSTCDDGSSQLGYYINSITVKNVGASSRTSNENVPNGDIAAFTVCLGDSVSKKAVAAGLQFNASVENSDGSKSSPQLLNADGNGCLRFTLPISYDFFAAENWQEKILHLVSLSSPYQDVSRAFPISIDPWQTGDQFFWDCRNGNRAVPAGKNVEMEMTNFSSTLLRQDYALDTSLNLTVNRQYQFEILPRWKISSAFGGIPTYSEVIDGKYHLRVLVLVPNENLDISAVAGMDTSAVLKNYKYLSSYEGDTEVRDGKIIQAVTLPVQFNELPLLGLRNTILIQVSALDNSSSLIAHPYYEAFVGSSPNNYFGLSPLTQGASVNSSMSNRKEFNSLSLDVESLIQTGKKEKAALMQENTSIGALAAAGNLKIASDEELSSAGFNDSKLQEIFSASKLSLASEKNLCKLLAGSHTAAWLKSCLLKPSTILQIARIDHLESISSDSKIVDSQYLPFTASANISISSQYSSSSSKSESDANTRSSSTSSTTTRSNDNSDTNSITKGDSGYKSVDATASTRVTAGTKAGINIFGTGAEVGVDASVGASATMGHSWFTTKSNTVANTTSISNSNAASKSNDRSHSSTVSKSTNSSRNETGYVGLSYNKNFGAEKLTFAIEGNIRSCYAVKSRHSHEQGYLICSQDTAAKQMRQESYYLVSEMAEKDSAQLRDTYSSDAAPLVLAIRGDAGFRAIQGFLTDSTRSMMLSATKVDYSKLDNLDDRLANFARTTPPFSDGAFPSVIY